MKYDKDAFYDDGNVVLRNSDIEALSLTAIGYEIEQQSGSIGLQAAKLAAVGLDKVANELYAIQSNISRLAARIHLLHSADLNSQIDHNAAMMGNLLTLALTKDITDKPGFKGGRPIQQSEGAGND